MEHPAPLQSTSLAGLRGWAPHEAVARLDAIAAALPELGDPTMLDALAKGLPTTVAELAPEVARALAELAMVLVPHGPALPRDVGQLEPRLRVAWQRVQLAAGDAVPTALDEVQLLAAVHGWSVDPVLEPLPLLRRMAGAHDPRLRLWALAWLVPAVGQLGVTPPEALELLLGLAADPDPRVRSQALHRLGEGWLRPVTPAAVRERERVVEEALADPEVSVARAAVATAAALGLREPLLALACDAPRPGPARADALEALGPLAQGEDLDVGLALARAEPLRFLPATRRFLLATHRHGVFLRAEHLDELLALFDAHAPWTGEEAFRVAFIVRTELVERLAALPADDPRWIRRASILAAAVGTRAHELLHARLEQVRDPAVARALIEAAGASPDYEGEAPLLAWLDALPEDVIPVLRVKGGARAEAELRARVEDPRCGSELRSYAMHGLWAVSRSRTTLLRELAARLGPHDAGLLDGKHHEPRDARLARLLADPPWPDDPRYAVDPLAAFEVLCESGDIELLPAVIERFRELLRGYVRRALAGDFTIKRLAQPELEQRLFRYGRHLVAAGRSVRRFIEPGPETGRDLVLRVAVEWLREEPAPAVCVALLELVGRHGPGATTLRMIEPLWRHGDREVRRAAIETILAAGEGARGLELSLCRLAEHTEPRLMIQALGAIATLGAQWAEPLVVAALRRPEMAIKKEAAHALARVGSERAVAPLVEWLAHHDNAAFRSELSAALGHAAGPTHVAVLVDALAHEREPRRIELLWDALGGRLSLAGALRLARSSQPSHVALLGACLAGRVALADASVERLAAALHRTRRLPRSPELQDPGRQLRVEGFSVAAARSLVELRTPALEASVLATVRGGLAEWIAWLRASEQGAEPQALALVLDAAQVGHAEQVGALLELGERERDAVDPGAVAGYLERCVAGRALGRAVEARAIGLLRGLPASARAGGLRRHRLLGQLGAVRTRSDLERGLEECRLGSGPAEALLTEALRIPPHAPKEPATLTRLRENVARWPTLEADARAHTLTALLDARPLDLDLVEPLAVHAEPRPAPGSAAELEALLATLRAGEEPERSQAATRLLDWSDAHAAWPHVLDAFLHGRIELDAAHYACLPPLLTRWPHDPRARRRAAELAFHCPPWQRRMLVQQWLDAWLAGDATLTDPLRDTREALLLPPVRAAAERGELRPLQLLRPSRSLAMQTLVAWVQARSPADVRHLLVPAPDTAPPVAHDEDPDDPIAGREPDELVALAEGKGVAKGLAVRAVHALVAHGERSVAPLSRLVTDPRPPVRSAALRALRRVASREQSLEAAARALAMETRRDVIVQLIKSLGHGRHEPSLSVLLEHLHHNDMLVRQGAHAAIRAWGHAVVPALRRAARRARPDRRPAYAALVAELEAIDD